jgi:hypothetical protein
MVWRGFAGIQKWYLSRSHGARHFFWGLALAVVVGTVVEAGTNKATYNALQTAQAEGFAAVKAFDPFMIYHRTMCALTPSVSGMNSRIKAEHLGSRYAYLGEEPQSDDCMYQLSTAPHPAGGLPTPVVGHRAEGLSGLVSPVVALLDVAWHLLFQPSLLAVFLSLSILIMGVMATSILMVLPNITWHPFLGMMVFVAGTVAMSCAAAYLVLGVMNAGLWLLSGVTEFGGLICAFLGIFGAFRGVVVKLVEAAIHLSAEHRLPG